MVDLGAVLDPFPVVSDDLEVNRFDM